MTPNAAAVDHGITILGVRLPAGTPLRASCLCGWLSPVMPARPHAAAQGEAHLMLARAGVDGPVPSDVPTRSSHCSCGRRAVQMFDGGAFGPTAYCGAPFPPLDPCDCGQGAARHDRAVCHTYGRGLPPGLCPCGLLLMPSD